MNKQEKQAAEAHEQFLAETAAGDHNATRRDERRSLQKSYGENKDYMARLALLGAATFDENRDLLRKWIENDYGGIFPEEPTPELTAKARKLKREHLRALKAAKK